MTDIPNGYPFESSQFEELLLRQSFPEKTQRESGVIRDFLLAHRQEFDRFALNVRVGQGIVPDPTHLPGVQANTSYSTRKRIDILAWRAQTPIIVEAKERVLPGALGQLFTYRHLFSEDFPDANEAELVCIGRYSDDDTLRALRAAGVSVYLYPTTDTASSAPAGGL